MQFSKVNVYMPSRDTIIIQKILLDQIKQKKEDKIKELTVYFD